MTPHFALHRLFPIAAVFAALAALAGIVCLPTPAEAHGFSTTVYVDATTPEPGTVRTEIELEYDLLVLSAAENEDAPELFDDGMDVFGTGEEAAALNTHSEAIVAYVASRFQVTAGNEPCAPAQVGAVGVTERQGVPYAVLTLDYTCEPAAAHKMRSELFPDEELFVKGTATIIEYDIDHASGNATLVREAPEFSTEQPPLERFGRFFILGAEHLLFGIDHILFLVALIVGSRRLRDIVVAATTFTIAHSVTFILAALGLVSLPAALVEPLIALSIAVVGCWYLRRVWRHRNDPEGLFRPASGRQSDRMDAALPAVVFVFGLLHGLGFASALGIDEPSSWSLLGSLLVFNVGIEAVQVAIILVAFPILAVLRNRAPRAGLLISVALATVVTAMGLVWFAQRIFGAE